MFMIQTGRAIAYPLYPKVYIRVAGNCSPSRLVQMGSSDRFLGIFVMLLPKSRASFTIVRQRGDVLEDLVDRD